MRTDVNQYYLQFENSNKLIGQTIKNIVFYLEPEDEDFTEQPNDYGKSLLNGIDIVTEKETFSIGNRYIDTHFGLSIDRGQTNELEFSSDTQLKTQTNYYTKVIGEKINEVKIYWLEISFPKLKGLYPQDIEIMTDNGFLLLSSIEVTYGKVCNPFTDELLVIESLDTAKQLKLGRFGERQFFRNIQELIEAESKNGI